MVDIRNIDGFTTQRRASGKALLVHFALIISQPDRREFNLLPIDTSLIYLQIVIDDQGIFQLWLIKLIVQQ